MDSKKTKSPVDGPLRAAIAARLKAGDSLRQIAREAGVPQPSLHRYYHHQSGLTLSTVEALAAALSLHLRTK